MQSQYSYQIQKLDIDTTLLSNLQSICLFQHLSQDVLWGFVFLVQDPVQECMLVFSKLQLVRFTRLMREIFFVGLRLRTQNTNFRFSIPILLPLQITCVHIQVGTARKLCATVTIVLPLGISLDLGNVENCGARLSTDRGTAMGGSWLRRGCCGEENIRIRQKE